MEPELYYPLDGVSDYLIRHCKLAPHFGKGKVANHGPPDHLMPEAFKRFRELSGHTITSPSDFEFDATILHPATGSALILLRGPAASCLSRNFGQGLSVKGTSAEGPFELVCPNYHVQSTSERSSDSSWAIARSVNGPITIRYGEDRPIAHVRVLINNFDFEYGNVRPTADDVTGREVLRVEAAGRMVEFTWRENHKELRRLVNCEVLRTTALVSFAFDAWPDGSEAELSAFAFHVASLCSVAAKQHTGIPTISFLDGAGQVVRRLLIDPVESAFRPGGVFDCPHFEDALPQLFHDCFSEHVRMQGSKLWSRLPLFSAAAEDPPYLEQKAATLMAAIELLLRSTLVERAFYTLEDAECMTLVLLVGAARGKLGWELPKHYTRKGRHGHLRNAVAHGNELPFSADSVRHDFDKWHLFLLRRLLMRMGFTGKVTSPENGWASTSPIDDFSESKNSFNA